MKKHRFSKFLLGGAGVPLLAAIAVSVFFSATPGLLYAGPLDASGVFMTQVDINGNSTTLQVRLRNGNNKNFVQISVDNVMREYQRNQSGNALNNDPAGPVIEKCFPKTGTATSPFTGADVQTILASYNANP